MPMLLFRIIVAFLVGQAATAFKLNQNNSRENEISDNSRIRDLTTREELVTTRDEPGWKHAEKIKCYHGVFNIVVEIAYWGLQAVRYWLWLDKDKCESEKEQDKKDCAFFALSAVEGTMGLLLKIEQVQGFCSQWEGVLADYYELTVENAPAGALTESGLNLKKSWKEIADKLKGEEASNMKAFGKLKLCRSFLMNTLGGSAGLAAASLQIDKTCGPESHAEVVGIKPFEQDSNPKEGRVIPPCGEAIARSALGGINVVLNSVKALYATQAKGFKEVGWLKGIRTYPFMHAFSAVMIASLGLATGILGAEQQCGTTPGQNMTPDMLCKLAGTKTTAKVLNIIRSLAFIGKKECFSVPGLLKFWKDWFPRFPDDSDLIGSKIEKLKEKKEVTPAKMADEIAAIEADALTP